MQIPSGAICRYCRRLREIQTSQKAAECEERMKAFLILEDGTVFEGTHIGADKEIISEIVFNTSMAGYLAVSYTHLDVYKRQRQHQGV